MVEKFLRKCFRLFKRILRKIYYFFFMPKPTPEMEITDEEASIINENICLKNAHKGKRCFVLGNGPSLKDVDFSLLQNEYVFTVNQIARMKGFEKLKTNFHFWADASFFRIDKSKPEDLELLEKMKAVKTEDNNPACFFPIGQRKFVKEHNLDEILDVHYYKWRRYYRSLTMDDLNFDTLVSPFHTVVHWAVGMAMYMGFSEIYLLGCDCTAILTTINSALKVDPSKDYAYEVSKNEQIRMQNLLKVNNLAAYVDSYLITLRTYKDLNDLCVSENIKLINLSSQTVIDSVPRDTLENVLNNKTKMESE